MAAPQEDPPFPEKGFTPKMMRFIRPLYGWMRRNRPVDGAEIAYVDAPGGGKQPVLTDAGRLAIAVTPFDLLKGSDSTHSRVRYGTVNSVIPSGMFIGDDPVFEVAITPPCVVFLRLTVSFDSATSLWTATATEIFSAGSIPTASATYAYCSLGSVSTAGKVASDRRGSLQWERCGDDTNYADTFV